MRGSAIVNDACFKIDELIDLFSKFFKFSVENVSELLLRELGNGQWVQRNLLVAEEIEYYSYSGIGTRNPKMKVEVAAFSRGTHYSGSPIASTQPEKTGRVVVSDETTDKTKVRKFNSTSNHGDNKLK
ncbi:hypothetical protein VNO78_18504 [Psophocarpus tetragonolobus]|uniref:Uncharacterized protein n=1 Tax=Psophocarpus tetragonolobus TaxID=3891 RepID=A0AAN9SIX7_PSOTE